MRPKVLLKDDGSSITMNGTKVVTRPTEIGNTISHSEFIYDLLKPINTLPGSCKLSGLYPKCSKFGR